MLPPVAGSVVRYRYGRGWVAGIVGMAMARCEGRGVRWAVGTVGRGRGRSEGEANRNAGNAGTPGLQGNRQSFAKRPAPENYRY